MSLWLLTLNRFHILCWCFYCWLESLCPPFFIKMFFTDDSPSKTINIFLFHRKISFRFRDIQTFAIFFLSALSRFKRKNESGKIMMSWIGLHELVDVNFGITQKLYYISSSDISNKEVFLNLIRNRNWSVAPGPFCFLTTLSIKRDWVRKKK